MSSSIRQLNASHTLEEFLNALSRDREIYALREGEEGQCHLVQAARWNAEVHTLGAVRPVEPLKAILFPARAYLGPLLDGAQAKPLPERIVIGVKNCDLSGLRIQDHLFLHLPPGDPRYAEARLKTVLVTCDCTGCREVCFCPVLGEQPYAEGGYDINLSPIRGQYLIDAGSVRGEHMLEELPEYLTEADEALLAAREDRRAALVERLVAQSAACGLHPGLDLAGAVRGAKDSGLWEEFAVDCVECGACNFCCCTCHCFLLADGVNGDGEAARGRQWDSCLLKNFARVAGGSNPRAGRAARLRNRFQKKFNYFPDVMGRYACDGCGRCTEACTGNIDIRAVLRKAVDESQSVHADPGDH